MVRINLSDQEIPTVKWPIQPEHDCVNAYDYELDDALIAAEPASSREQARLLVAQRTSNTCFHHSFSDLPTFLRSGDLLVFNNTRVIRGRIMTQKTTGGRVELLVLDIISPSGDNRFADHSPDGTVRFSCMTKTSKHLRVGQSLQSASLQSAAADTSFEFIVESCTPGFAEVRIAWPGSPIALLELCGEMPLPPYIVNKRQHTQPDVSWKELDETRYQTVYAAADGAIAAPTAGLHFTQAMLEDLSNAGVEHAFITLKVGPGTFKPVTADRLSEHEMHTEDYVVDDVLGAAIERTRQRGGRVIAVGTTSARALEAEAQLAKPFAPGHRKTDIFLYPGAPFQVCDGLITNFHLPRSTLLALVAGFAGYEFMRKIYDEAIANGYRFYSYGDSSLIL